MSLYVGDSIMTAFPPSAKHFDGNFAMKGDDTYQAGKKIAKIKKQVKARPTAVALLSLGLNDCVPTEQSFVTYLRRLWAWHPIPVVVLLPTASCAAKKEIRQKVNRVCGVWKETKRSLKDETKLRLWDGEGILRGDPMYYDDTCYHLTKEGYERLLLDLPSVLSPLIRKKPEKRVRVTRPITRSLRRKTRSGM